MSRLVFHPLTAEPILLSPERSERPGAWGETAGAPDARCPFCPGNEEETPPELSRRNQGKNWRSRVVPNKYPAVGPLGGVASHEVLIDTPEHDSPLESRDAEGWRELIELWRERVVRHASRPEIESVVIFRNEGRAAGQSIAHPHSQLLALPFVPPRLAQEVRSFDEARECPLCADLTLAGEPSRVVAGGDDGMMIICPRAPRLPYESWIVPRRHSSDWYAESAEPVATALRIAIRALRSRWPGVPYNLALTASASHRAGRARHHWHLEILPRLTNLAGFELATGSWMNIVEPERAAAELRARLKS